MGSLNQSLQQVLHNDLSARAEMVSEIGPAPFRVIDLIDVRKELVHA